MRKFNLNFVHAFRPLYLICQLHTTLDDLAMDPSRFSRHVAASVSMEESVPVLATSGSSDDDVDSEATDSW